MGASIYEQVKEYLNIDSLNDREIKIIDYVKRKCDRFFKSSEDNFNFD